MTLKAVEGCVVCTTIRTDMMTNENLGSFLAFAFVMERENIGTQGCAESRHEIFVVKKCDFMFQALGNLRPIHVRSPCAQSMHVIVSF